MQSDSQWNILHEIFEYKSYMTLKYEAKKLVCEVKPQKPWNTEEEIIFKQIMQYYFNYQEMKNNSRTDGIKKQDNFTSCQMVHT